MKEPKKYLKLVEIDKKDKTSVYRLENLEGGYLGNVKWFGPFRKYCFFPVSGCVFDVNCLNEIISLITGLMDDRTKKTTNLSTHGT